MARLDEGSVRSELLAPDEASYATGQVFGAVGGRDDPYSRLADA
jgi:hypothetical protein